MKKGLNQWSVPKATGIEEMISLAASAGFDGVEFLYREEAELGPHVSLEESRRIARRAAEEGIEIIGFASGTLLNKYSLVHGSAVEKAKSRGIVEHMFETAEALGASSILCVPGAVDAKAQYDEVMEKVRAFLPAIVPYAEKYRVPVCVENVWNRFLLSPVEMRDLIDEVGSPCIGSYFDVGNILPYGFPDQWIRILGERIKRVHVKDYRTGAAGEFGMVGLGEGDVDWVSVMKALREVGYDGYLTAEIPPTKIFPEKGIAAISSFIDGIIGLEQ